MVESNFAMVIWAAAIPFLPAIIALGGMLLGFLFYVVAKLLFRDEYR